MYIMGSKREEIKANELDLSGLRGVFYEKI